ncbi:ComF family protein [Amycolatopsis suaedae]|uniref:ComF family protein n=1 Tax=Amycolatopsis suaedae TaxID=2510978 RepID=A0A4Q7J1U3_9PSEU|nr:phosphoribosyltransferase family protein [Amycolatopsis suaedae]RZQ60708.1 ComF family protein [Amycolatopsis suaedae]
MRLFEHLSDIVLPSTCPGCGRWSRPCCADCVSLLRRLEPVERGPTGRLRLYALGTYAGPARQLVLAYKERGRRDLAAPLAAVLAEALLELAIVPGPGRWWLVPAPSRAAASRLRGGPHMELLARRCAAALTAVGRRAAVAPALRLARGVRDAAGLTAAARADNLAGRVGVVRARLPPRGEAVVLVDDVVTTGVTAAACARALREAGVRVRAFVALTAAT